LLKSRTAGGRRNAPMPEFKEAFNYLTKNIAEQIQSIPENENKGHLQAVRHQLNLFLRSFKDLEMQDYPYFMSFHEIYKYLDFLNFYFSQKGVYVNHNVIEGETVHGLSELLTFLVNDEVVLIPVVSQVSFRYFIETHYVRIYVIGISLQPFNEVDNQILSPLAFLIHDLMHAKESERSFLELFKGANIEQLTLQMKENTQKILSHIDKLKHPEEREAAEIILFDKVHEGRCLKLDSLQKLKDLLQLRSDMKNEASFYLQVQERMLSGFYGKDKINLASYLQTANDEILGFFR
jgi:hypothetical protein